ncbi:CBF-domain-containing protein [Phanerochaete sordida]|uniref:CBF-domain-containing protein n=1 Tax=Phanerochaete sordida TaxID=48140 RepID=A0A9P3LCJ9_9APHY|nr:CBF-domain-containing protein [Phanerochaete sordida]
MAKADKAKSAPKKAANDAAKQSPAKAQAKKGKKSGKVNLEEQVLALGGDKEDVALLKGVNGDKDLIQGEQAVDPSLANDVSKFLAGLKTGSEPKAKAQPKSKAEPKPKPKAKDAKPDVKPAEAKEKPSKKKEQKKQDAKKPDQKKQKAKASDATQDEPEAAEPSAAPEAPKPTGVKTTGKLLLAPNPHWYTALAPLATPAKPVPTPSTSQISALSEKAAQLLQADAAAYQASSAFTGNSASDSHFLNTILSKGTLSDRLSALTLLVQASPVHNIKALETLKGMAERGRGKGGRDEGLKAMRCVVDWWVGGGAPTRKLRYFRDQPLLHPDVTDQHLLVWHFEDWLKKYFFQILQTLETYSLDTLPYVRTQALSFITTLLREKPEQEQNLLRLLVNKLGDTERSVCSRASYHLLQLLQSHPAMKAVIVREIRALIFRPAASTSAAAQQALAASTANTHIRFDDDEKPASKPKGKGKETKTNAMERWNSHAWYYSAVTLNQVVLTASDHDRDVARVLIDVYFEMFREILGGIKGDAPVVDADEDGGDDKKDKKKKGKAKEVRGDAGFAEVEDAHSRLVSAVLTGVNRALPFARLDMAGSNAVFVQHMDTLFRITHTSTFNISLQALLLVFQITAALPAAAPSTSKDAAGFATGLRDRFYRTLYASLLDQRLATSNKQAMYLNLLFKALKADTNVERVKAFVRRFIQILAVGVSATGGMEFVAGGLYLLGELFSTVPGLRQMLNVSPAASEKTDEAYDPKKRDPQYAHASVIPLYELLPLLHHYHPAIALHARQLLTGRPITATADLSLNTISHFLDRFVYKNAKKPKPKGASAMQPAATAADGTGVKLLKGEVAHGEAPVNDEKWWRRRAEDVPVDELFFHRYFTQKNRKEKEMQDKVKKRKGKDDEDDSEDDDDEELEFEGEASDEEEDADAAEEQSDGEEVSDKDEAEIWKAMKASLPAELQGGDLSDDSDDLPDGLDDDSDIDEGEGGGEEDEDEDVSRVEDEDDDEDVLSMVEASDAEDLIPFDEADGLIEYDGSDAEEEEAEWGGIDGGASKKRKRGGDEEGKKRKKLRSLPTFASYEDYAKLIEDGPEDDI